MARAAADAAGVRRVLIVGSQAVLGSFSEDELPAEALRSIEVDVVVLDDPDGRAHHTVEGAIGYMSQFHTTFGYYAEGVERGTARMPEGWEGRVVTRRAELAGGDQVTVHFPEVHDLCVSKLVAGRIKDREYVESLIEAGVVDPRTLLLRAQRLSEPHDEVIARVVDQAKTYRQRFEIER